MNLTKDQIKKFNLNHQKLFDLLKINKMVLNGSYPTSMFAGDVDLYEKVSISELDDVINHIIKIIVNNDFLNIYRMKVGNTKLKSIKQIGQALSNPDYIRKQLKQSDNQWLKIDFLPLSNGYVEDVTVIYDFGTMGRSNVLSSIKDSLNELLSDKQYFKALKRMKSLYRITKNKILPQITQFLDDPKVGFMYLTLSRIKALQNADLTRDERAEVLGNINEDILIKLNGMYGRPIHEKIIYNKDLTRVKNKLLKMLNDQAYHFIRNMSQ